MYICMCVCNMFIYLYYVCVVLDDIRNLMRSCVKGKRVWGTKARLYKPHICLRGALRVPHTWPGRYMHVNAQHTTRGNIQFAHKIDLHKCLFD